MKTHHYQMQNTLEDVDRMVLCLLDCVGADLDPTIRFGIETCASEALSNIVKHALSDAPIDLMLILTAQTIAIEIYDPFGSTPFDLRDYATPLDDLDPMSETGRGISLILHYADAVDYGLNDGRNRLVLEFTKSCASAPNSLKPLRRNRENEDAKF